MGVVLLRHVEWWAEGKKEVSTHCLRIVRCYKVAAVQDKDYE